MVKKSIEEISAALKKVAWDINATKDGAKPLLVAYPNEVLCELYGKEYMEQYWIDGGA